MQLRKTGAQSHQGELGFKAEPVLTDRLWVLRQFEHISSPVKQDEEYNTLMGGWSDEIKQCMEMPSAQYQTEGNLIKAVLQTLLPKTMTPVSIEK